MARGLLLQAGYMPSSTHQILVELFRRRPALLTDLLGPLSESGPPLAVSSDARIVPTSATLADLVSAELRADLALHVLSTGSDRPTRTLLIEAQLRPDPDKRYSWPLYSAAVRARDRCPVTSIVLTLDERTARWAGQPVVLDPFGTHVFRPVVIGPGDIPWITDLAQARTAPELTMLSALVHCRTPGGEHVVRAALTAAGAALDMPFRVLYAHAVWALLDEDMRRTLEVLMHFEGSSFDDEIKRYWYNVGLETARQFLSPLLTKQLTQRFGALPPIAMARIYTADAEQLKHWGERVLTAASLDDVFDGAP